MKWVGAAMAVVLAGLVGACVSTAVPVITTPKYPDFPALTLPPGTPAPPDAAQRFDVAWRRLQTGDVGGARRDYSDILVRSPGCYPARAGLGYVGLANHDYKDASAQFSAAITASPKYLPALTGSAEAEIGLGDDAAAIATLQAILKIEPNRETARTRLDVLRLRQVQMQIDAGRHAREAGKLDDAQASLDRALALAPDNAIVLREMALVDVARGRLPGAEAHARKAVQVDVSDADAFALLGDILEREEKFKDAADAYNKAVALDPRPAWSDKRAALRQKADDVSLPSQYRVVASLSTVTRGDVAAVIGIRLGDVLARAQTRAAVVATDVRNHWAGPWIVPVTQTGVMEVFPNHTFQPALAVRRSDLARIVQTLLAMISAQRPIDIARWKAARPKFTDVEAGSASYPAAALAVASGAMSVDAGRFALTRVVTGAELVSAITRLQQIAAQ